jgi:plastocyanin
MKFIPDRLEVAVGDRITWTNKDFLPHTVTAQSPRIESGELKQDQSFSYVVKRPGEIAYICRLHPVMKGLVVAK